MHDSVIFGETVSALDCGRAKMSITQRPERSALRGMLHQLDEMKVKFV